MQLPFYLLGSHLDWLHHRWWGSQAMVRDRDWCVWPSNYRRWWYLFCLGLLPCILPNWSRFEDYIVLLNGVRERTALHCLTHSLNFIKYLCSGSGRRMEETEAKHQRKAKELLNIADWYYHPKYIKLANSFYHRYIRHIRDILRVCVAWKIKWQKNIMIERVIARPLKPAFLKLTLGRISPYKTYMYTRKTRGTRIRIDQNWFRMSKYTR